MDDPSRGRGSVADDAGGGTRGGYLLQSDRCAAGGSLHLSPGEYLLLVWDSGGGWAAGLDERRLGELAVARARVYADAAELVARAFLGAGDVRSQGKVLPALYGGGREGTASADRARGR